MDFAKHELNEALKKTPEDDCIARVDTGFCHACNGHDLKCPTYLPPQRPVIGPEGP
ncbi:MAG: hypothetical protein UY48_C0013G0006 [Candidatus Gottesmanbacteria bacterium GW2011_GWB1_49_7]|uniref:Uncharacterized protein n=1 Tax=Candidatus Gottesmanbacteria bacterium GW2011_GWB1_49_7 TaxID=1618448 RepID=A0A0G1VZH7_9BACT|nr:MAG: hypothetical protein UY48_C0013G0006 [Candidatus Gottesmanbacteria bacterium GW2011_GWB1_49_7]